MSLIVLDHPTVVKELVTALVDLSVYFRVTPLPDERYEIEVKEDCSHILHKALKESFEDGEIIGVDTDGSLILWNADNNTTYNSGEPLEAYSDSELSKKELTRVKL